MLGTQGDFRFTTKVTKGVSGGLPPEPPWGHYHPPSSAARCSPQKDSPRGVGGELVVCASLRARGCRGPFYPQPIPLGQGAGESKGVLPLVLEVQEPGGSWRIFGDFLFARKSPGAAGRSARIRGRRDCHPRKNPPGPRGARIGVAGPSLKQIKPLPRVE